VHLLVNATIAQGGTVFQQQVDKIHSLPFLQVIEWTAIFLPIIFHAVYGTWILVSGQPNATHYPFERNVLYVLQRASAVILVFFILFHVLAFKYGWFGAGLSFDPQAASDSVVRHLHVSWLITWVVYPIGILAATFHLANGFWAAGITWGLTVSAAGQRRWGLVCIGLFLLSTMAGFTALIAAALADPRAMAVTTGH
jgi:succinate dehydrogenase / fumarate reductase cytochrome b subunit